MKKENFLLPSGLGRKRGDKEDEEMIASEAAGEGRKEGGKKQKWAVM